MTKEFSLELTILISIAIAVCGFFLPLYFSRGLCIGWLIAIASIVVAFAAGRAYQEGNLPRCPICNSAIYGNDSYRVEIDGHFVPVCSTCKTEVRQRWKAQKKRERKQRIDDLLYPTSNRSSTERYIPANVKREVWRRDEGKCVECGSKNNLENDHIIPVTKGGSSTARNIQLLCERCNRAKSDSIQ